VSGTILALENVLSFKRLRPSTKFWPVLLTTPKLLFSINHAHCRQLGPAECFCVVDNYYLRLTL